MVKKEFVTVYNEDIFEAGYDKFVFSTYIWWEVLLAIVLVEVVCGSFVLVWSAEEEKEKVFHLNAEKYILNKLV